MRGYVEVTLFKYSQKDKKCFACKSSKIWQVELQVCKNKFIRKKKKRYRVVFNLTCYLEKNCCFEKHQCHRRVSYKTFDEARSG